MWGRLVMPPSGRLGWPVKTDSVEDAGKGQGELMQVLPSTLMLTCFPLRTGNLEGSGDHRGCRLPCVREKMGNVPPTTTHCRVGAGAASGQGPQWGRPAGGQRRLGLGVGRGTVALQANPQV